MYILYLGFLFPMNQGKDFLRPVDLGVLDKN